MRTLYLDRSARAARRRDRRRALRPEARPLALALAVHHRRRGLVPRVDRDLARRQCRARVQRRRLHMDAVRWLQAQRGLPDRPADRADAARRDVRFPDGAHLHDRLHGRRRRIHPVLQLHLALHVQHADAGDEQQLPAAVLRLGSRRSRFVPADRLLQDARVGDLREPQGVSRQPRRRLRLRAGHRSRLRLFRHARLRAGVRRRRQSGRNDDQPAGRRAVAADGGDLRLPVRRGDGQVGAGSASRVAARLDGGPDPNLRADPRGDDGDGRHLHGRANEPAFRALRRGALLCHGDRRDGRAVPWDPGHRSERHQARRRVLDALAARLHDGRARRVRLCGRDLPPDDARVLQGAPVPRRRLGDHRDAPRPGHAQHGRPVEVHADHLRDDVDRKPGAVRHPAVRRFLLEGRDHRGRARVGDSRPHVRVPRRRRRRVRDGVLLVPAASS